MDNGWVKLHRKILEWEWYTDVNTKHLFEHLLLTANHKPARWRGKIILAGQLVTGRYALAEATGLSPQSVRTSLERLKSTNEITIQSTNKYSLITILNWPKYQGGDEKSTSQLPYQSTNNQPTTNQQSTTNNNGKNGKNDNNTTDNFKKTYPPNYPQRQRSEDGMKAIGDILKIGHLKI